MATAEFELVVGLEVHAQLLTHSKLFSTAPTAFGGEPNAHTTPLCLGMPGALPVVNAKAVEFAVTTGLALGCHINERSVWARKHYFYPDLPKGYQISQYEQPLCEHGHLEFDGPGGMERVRIRRIHMEEDAGKSTHDAVDGASLVDLNRAGTPLVEIVSEPDLRHAKSAAEYLRVLRDVLVELGVNDGNLEEGSFRCDANVSVRKKGATELGTRTELKNINSFRFVEQAIEREFERQVAIVEAGQKVVQETRLYDPDRDETRAMRSKEDAPDYRYFPDPDLPVLIVPAAQIEKLRASLPELPRAKVKRYVDALGLSEADARVIAGDGKVALLFERASGLGASSKRVAALLTAFVVDEWRYFLHHDLDVATVASALDLLAKSVDSGAISFNAAKGHLAPIIDAQPGKPAVRVETMPADDEGRTFQALPELNADARIPKEPGVATEPFKRIKVEAQVSDASAIEPEIQKILAANPSQVAAYRAGKTQMLGFFVGQVMKAMKGKANPKVVNDLVTKALSESAS